MLDQMRPGITDLLRGTVSVLVISVLFVLYGCAEQEPVETEGLLSGTTDTVDSSKSEPGPAAMPVPAADTADEPASQPEARMDDTEDVADNTVDTTDAAPEPPTFSIPEETRARLAAPIEKVTPDGVEPVDAGAALEKFSSDNLDEAFSAVASGIAYEPYSGVLRGAGGTALAGSGNAIDQALLLASVLDGHVSAWRIAEGRLDDEALSGLLATVGRAYEGDHAFAEDDPERYDPSNEARFREVAKVHYWLEVKVAASDSWLALDPSYPNASVGQSFATATRRLDIPDALMMRRVELRFMQETADGKVQRVGAISGHVADLAMHPIVLVTRGMPQFDAEQAAPEEDPDETGDGLPGGEELPVGDSDELEQTGFGESTADAVTTPAIIGTEYQRELIYGGNEAQALTSTTVTEAEPASRIVREWVEFILRTPGAANREVVRDLYHASSENDAPATVRRYSIALLTGRVSREMFEGYRARLDPDEVSSARQRLAELQAQPATSELAFDILELESASALTPHLMNLALAYESDELTERLASGAAVSVIRDTPRILITTVETGMTGDGSTESRTTMGLLVDEVHAVPYTGMPVSTARLFQRARGMQQSVLEGRVLARFVDQPADVVTTARIMHDAMSQDRQLVLLSPDERVALQELTDLPDRVASRISTALDAGHEIILPSGATTIAGEDRWGWWQVDPATGAFAGIMDGGLQQAMVRYTVNLAETGVAEPMRSFIGGIVDSAVTMNSYAARMLQYGQITDRLTQEVAAVIRSLTCDTCPDVEVDVVPLSSQDSPDSPCLDRPVATAPDPDGDLPDAPGFCETYKLRISCAASLMLGALTHDAEAGISPGFSPDLAPLNCH